MKIAYEYFWLSNDRKGRIRFELKQSFVNLRDIDSRRNAAENMAYHIKYEVINFLEKNHEIAEKIKKYVVYRRNNPHDHCSDDFCKLLGEYEDALLEIFIPDSIREMNYCDELCKVDEGIAVKLEEWLVYNWDWITRTGVYVDMLTQKEILDKFKISRCTLYRMIKEGKFPPPP